MCGGGSPKRKGKPNDNENNIRTNVGGRKQLLGRAEDLGRREEGGRGRKERREEDY